MFYVGSYPVYEFESSSKLAETTLGNILNLDYKPVGESKQVSLGYVNENGVRKQYQDDKLFAWLYECIRQVEENHFINLQLKIVDIWAVRAKFGERSIAHSHTNSMFSGVYHLSNCDRSELVFSTTDRLYDDWKFLLRDNLKKKPIEVSVQPKKGKLYIWPSSLIHQINPHTGKEERYSVAFNTFFEMNEQFDTKRLSIKCIDQT